MISQKNGRIIKHSFIFIFFMLSGLNLFSMVDLYPSYKTVGQIGTMPPSAGYNIEKVEITDTETKIYVFAYPLEGVSREIRIAWDNTGYIYDTQHPCLHYYQKQVIKIPPNPNGYVGPVSLLEMPQYPNYTVIGKEGLHYVEIYSHIPAFIYKMRSGQDAIRDGWCTPVIEMDFSDNPRIHCNWNEPIDPTFRKSVTIPYDAFVPNTSVLDSANGFLLALAAYDSYNDADTWGRQLSELEYLDTVRKVFTRLGISKISYLNDQTTNSQALVLSNASVVIIAFRGTQGFVDDLTDIDAVAVQCNEGDKNVYVHRGFNAAYQGLKTFCHLSNTLITHDARNKKLWLTGHSLGGALAAIAAFSLHHEGFVIDGVYTFGAPKPGNKMFAEYCQNMANIKSFQSIVNDNDAVPLLPSRFIDTDRHTRYNYHHPGKLSQINEYGVVIDATSETWVGNFADHAMKYYLFAMYDRIPAQLQTILCDYYTDLPAVLK